MSSIALHFQDDPRFENLREDLSAVVLMPDNHLWLAADEAPDLERLTWDGEAFRQHQAFPLADFFELPAGPDEEIDIEGLSYDGSYLWLVGSHSRKIKKPKGELGKKDIKRLTFAETATEPNRYLLGRIPLVDGALRKSAPDPKRPGEQLTAAALKIKDGSNALVRALEADPHSGPYISAKIPGKANGLDIEGLEAIGNRLLLGLRGPVLLEWAILLQVEPKPKSNGTLGLEDIGPNNEPYRKFFVNLQGLGIRDLCQDGQDLLILAGPTQFLDGPAKVFRLPNVADLEPETMYKPKEILDIPCGVGTDHPEGITLPRGVTGEPTLLVIYDAPTKSRWLSPNGVNADVVALPQA